MADAKLLDLILKEGQHTAIQELEMLGLVAGFELLQEHLLRGSKLVLITDGEAVRGAFLTLTTPAIVSS